MKKNISKTMKPVVMESGFRDFCRQRLENERGLGVETVDDWKDLMCDVCWIMDRLSEYLKKCS